MDMSDCLKDRKEKVILNKIKLELKTVISWIDCVSDIDFLNIC